MEFRILGPLGVLEDGHQVVRHRTRALRACPADLARFIEEQRAPPGSTTLAPVDPPPTWGNSVIGSEGIRPIGLTRGRLLLLGKGGVLAHRFDRPLAAESDEKHNLASASRSIRARRSWRSYARGDIGVEISASSETPSFCRPNRSMLVRLALRPSTPAPREQRQPKREQRGEATDSEAHGIPAGPVFR